MSQKSKQSKKGQHKAQTPKATPAQTPKVDQNPKGRPEDGTSTTAKGNTFETYKTENPVFAGSGVSASALTSRKAHLENLVERGIVSKPMANLITAYTSPKGDAEHMDFNDAVKTFFPGETTKDSKTGETVPAIVKVRGQMASAALDIVRDLYNGEAFTNRARAKEADEANKGKGRKKRTKEQIAEDKRIDALESAARKSLGIPLAANLLSLSAEQQTAIREYIDLHKNDPVTETAPATAEATA